MIRMLKRNLQRLISKEAALIVTVEEARDIMETPMVQLEEMDRQTDTNHGVHRICMDEAIQTEEATIMETQTVEMVIMGMDPKILSRAIDAIPQVTLLEFVQHDKDLRSWP